MKTIKIVFILLTVLLRVTSSSVANNRSSSLLTTEVSSIIPENTTDTISIEAVFNTTYPFNASSSLSWNFHFKYNFSKETEHNLFRIHLRTEHGSKNYPLISVVKLQRGVISWQLPLDLNGIFYNEVNRTLCPVQNYPNAGGAISVEQDIFLDISTASPTYVNFNLEILEIPNYFQIGLNEKRTVTVSPSQPQYFQAYFPPDTNVLLIRVTSDDHKICTVVSVQEANCPVFDLEKNVQYAGQYQTMLGQAGLTIRRKQDSMNETFFIVIVVKSDDYDCTYMSTIRPSGQMVVNNRLKNVTIVVEKKITEDEYYIAIFGSVGFCVLFYLLSLMISVVFCCRPAGPATSWYLPVDASDDSPCDMTSPDVVRGSNFVSGYQAIAGNDQRGDGDQSSIEEDLSSIDEDDIDMLHDATSDKEIFRTKTFLYVCDLARKDPRLLSKKSKLYSWLLLTVAVFYAVPVVQLVITYEVVVHVTGNQDTCYYNFLCAHPFGVLNDFNHVYSNIAYVLLGVLFFILVWRREMMYERTKCQFPRIEELGIPQHFGLYYAMALALITEGILSGSYHVCPNQSNFQFDTSFMYVIAGLCMLKIYQTRHPDINANAYASIVAFSVVVLIGVVGVLEGTEIFWIAFTACHVLSCLALSAQVYYMGRWKLNLGIFKRIYRTCLNDLLSSSHCCRPLYLDRITLLVVGNLINFTIATFGFIYKPKDFASHLLSIFMVNLALHFVFYIIMKLRSRERILPVPLIYIMLSFIAWGASSYFFFNSSTSWQYTPAQSKEHNRPCLLLHFYDDHDIWHFLSASSMFFSFMTLLTLDDDLTFTRRDKIPVF